MLIIHIIRINCKGRCYSIDFNCSRWPVWDQAPSDLLHITWPYKKPIFTLSYACHLTLCDYLWKFPLAREFCLVSFRLFSLILPCKIHCMPCKLPSLLSIIRTWLWWKTRFYEFTIHIRKKFADNASMYQNHIKIVCI